MSLLRLPTAKAMVVWLTLPLAFAKIRAHAHWYVIPGLCDSSQFINDSGSYANAVLYGVHSAT